MNDWTFIDRRLITKQSLKDKNRFFEIARGSALECAAIHDVLRVCDAITDESNTIGKSNLKRIPQFPVQYGPIKKYQRIERLPLRVFGNLAFDG